MTYDEYIKNPMGTGSSVIANRVMYQQMYSTKWDAILVRENGAISYRLYNKNDEYFIHMKIPSEVVPKFYYDTIIRFYLTKEHAPRSLEKTLSNYDVQFYSNDPSFVYSFAHAFKKNGMLIKDLEHKMSEQALKEKASIKNPKDELGYVKSLYFAFLQIKTLNLFNKGKWDSVSVSYTKNVWNSTVDHADDKIKDRQELGNALEKKEKREKQTEQNQKDASSHKKPFSSPNITNFGHFKKTDYNAGVNSKPNKGIIGRFKNKIVK